MPPYHRRHCPCWTPLGMSSSSDSTLHLRLNMTELYQTRSGSGLAVWHGRGRERVVRLQSLSPMLAATLDFVASMHNMRAFVGAASFWLPCTEKYRRPAAVRARRHMVNLSLDRCARLHCLLIHTLLLFLHLLFVA